MAAVRSHDPYIICLLYRTAKDALLPIHFSVFEVTDQSVTAEKTVSHVVLGFFSMLNVKAKLSKALTS